MMPHCLKPQSLTFATAEGVYKQIFAALKGNTSSIHIQLSAVSICDSAGLALLIEAKRLAKMYDKKIEIASIPSIVHDLAVFCGVEKLLV